MHEVVCHAFDGRRVSPGLIQGKEATVESMPASRSSCRKIRYEHDKSGLCALPLSRQDRRPDAATPIAFGTYLEPLIFCANRLVLCSDGMPIRS